MSNNCQRPHILFSVINWALSHPTAAPLVESLSLMRKSDSDTKQTSHSSKGRSKKKQSFISTKRTQTLDPNPAEIL